MEAPFFHAQPMGLLHVRTDDFPKPLQEAVTRLLAVEGGPDRELTPAERIARIRQLRDACGILGDWHEGRVTTAQAVEQLDALTTEMAS